jgi:uncharacterized protein YneF (UPF0154 family)
MFHLKRIAMKKMLIAISIFLAFGTAHGQWIANKKNFKKVDEHTRVLKNHPRRVIRSMITIVLTNNNYLLDTMIFNSKSPVPFFQSWESSTDVNTMAVIENEKGNYDIYLFHHRREDTYYFTLNGQDYGYNVE